MHLTQLEAIVAILLGTGGIGRGAWGTVAAILRRAAAIEGFRSDVRENLPKLVEATAALAQLALRHDGEIADHGRRLDDHDTQLAHLKENYPCHPTSHSLPPPVSTRFP